MKKLIVSLALVALVGIANAALNLVPNGDFAIAGGTNWVFAGVGATPSYPAAGGNTGGYAKMDQTAGGWGGVFVSEDSATAGRSLASLGVTAGGNYTFSLDMISLGAGTPLAGMKIESWAGGSILDNSGDINFTTTASWATYTFNYTINPAATSLKFVPLMVVQPVGSIVGFDNIGVIVITAPLAVSITSPANAATVSPSFSITATATVNPGTVTNVDFYVDAALVGNDTSFPYSYAVSGASLGAHALKVVARDSGGNSATSSVVNITVITPVVNAYEPFNYTLGAFANGTPATGAGISGNWTVGNGTIVAGLTYPSLLTSNRAISMTAGRTEVSFASPVSSGTKYFSFLFNQTGANGANLNGLYLKGSGVTSLMAGMVSPTAFGLGAVTTTSAGATAISLFSGQQINGFTMAQTHLVVVRIVFNTSGANDTVTLWLDPAAGTSTPTGTPIVWSSFDVGTLTGIGFNVQGGGNPDLFDEIHVGDTFGSVVTDVPLPLAVSITSPINTAVVDENFSVTATASVNPGTIVNVDFYLDGGLVGSDAVAPYIAPVTGVAAGAHTLQAVAQDSFANSVTSSVVNITVVVIPPTVISAYEPFNYTTLANGNPSTATGFTGNWTIAGTANIIGNMSYPSLPTLNNAFQQSPAGQRDVVSLGTSLVKGTVYLSFLYNQTGDNGGNANGLYLPGTGVTSLYVGLTGPWSGSAGKLGLGTTTTAGAGAAGISVLAEMPGPAQTMNYNQTNLIVVKIAFNTSGNNDTVSLWLNPTAGVAAPAGNINAPNPDLVVSTYDVGTITGIGFNFNGGGAVQQYDEIRVANTFGEVVGVAGGVNTTPTNIVTSVSGNQLMLSWPADHTGWTLQSQTNNLSTGLAATWFNVAGSSSTNGVTFTIDPANPTVFFRLVYP